MGRAADARRGRDPRRAAPRHRRLRHRSRLGGRLPASPARAGALPRPGDPGSKRQPPPPPPRRPAPPGPPPPPAPPARPAPPAGSAADTSRIRKLLRQRAAPFDHVVVRVREKLVPGSKYLIRARGATNLNGASADGQAVLAVPVPKPARAPRDTAPAPPPPPPPPPLRPPSPQ